MELVYKKKDDTTFTCWYRDFCDTLEVISLNDGEEYGPIIQLPKEVHKDWDNSDCEFTWDGETFKFKDFEALTVDELIEKVDAARAKALATGHRPWMSEHEALCTFLKYSDNIGVIAEVECFNTVIPEMGIGLKGSGSKIARVLMVPVEDRYKKTDWHYKIDLEPYGEEYKPLVGREHPYFSDFWSTVVNRPDIYRLVNLEKYLVQENPILFELTGKIHK